MTTSIATSSRPLVTSSAPVTPSPAVTKVVTSTSTAVYVCVVCLCLSGLLLPCVSAFGKEGEKLNVTRVELWVDGGGQAGMRAGVLLVGVVDDQGVGMHGVPVSSFNWTLQDGRVACRHLGFAVNNPEISQGKYFNSNGLVVLNCTGEEESLGQCEAVFNSCCPPAALNCTEPAQPTTTLQSSSTLQTSSTLQSSTSNVTDEKKTEVPLYVPIVASVCALVVVASGVTGVIIWKKCCRSNQSVHG